MKIIFFEMEEWERETFSSLKQEHEVVFLDESLNSKNGGDFADADIVSVFVGSELNRETIDQMPGLKMIATRSTGFDHIDMKVCRKRDICVCNVPTYGENTVAEHVFGLLLTISHRLVESIDRTRKGDFSPKGLEGFDLRGKTLGLIGTGHIGSHVARIAKGFEMEVIAYDIKPDPDLDAVYMDFEELLKKSDIISLHIPGGSENVDMLSSKEFDMMKEGVVLINTARGDLVDVQALLQALTAGKVLAAGLDVLPEEPLFREEAELLRVGFKMEKKLGALLANHILIHMRNVVITPHNAFHTRESLQRIIRTTLDNIEGFLEGKCLNPV